MNRPRSDLFMQHFLASRQGQDIPIKHLFVEYRHWLEFTKPFPNVTVELATLARQGDHFRRIIAPEEGDIIFGLCSFLETYDIRTTYPLLLAIMEADPDDKEWATISLILESYLLRRAVCDFTTNNYNRIFLSLTRNLRKEGFSAANLKNALLSQAGDSVVWPDDATFREAWLHKPLYGPLNSPKLVHLYTRLNQTFISSKSERVVFSEPPTIEHIMPQTWVPNWSLLDGSKGMEFMEIIGASETEPRAIASRKRQAALQTLGNMTLLSHGLNSAQSNLGWDQKRPEITKHSLLPINLPILETKTWDEGAILSRGQELFERALRIWTR